MTPNKPPPPSAQADKFMLRLQNDGLRKQLKIRAIENERTLNAEILYLVKLGLKTEQAKGAGK